MAKKQKTDFRPALAKDPLFLFVKRITPDLDYLAMRWEDEKKYEDIGEYAAVFEKRFAYIKKTDKIVVTLVRMLKRPFGFVFQLGGRQFKLAVVSGYVRLSA